jgi:hypothetical protein
MTSAADYTFFAADYDRENGARACRGLADAFAGGRDPRGEEIREAMATAADSFPGLQDFVDAMEDRSLDPEDAMMDVSGVAAGMAGPELAAAAKLALIGAMAKAAERFDWDDVVDCARFCQEAFARRAEAGVR